MLTGPLLITTFRKGKAYPYKLANNEENRDMVSDLIYLFEESIESKRFEIEENIKGYAAEASNPKIIQGIAKILFARSEFSNSSEENPQERRERVFSASADYWKSLDGESSPDILIHKRRILESIDEAKPEHLENTDSWMFGDVVSNQRLTKFETISPEKLIHRFNIEQVQGLLLNALSLDLTIQKLQEATFRQVMQMVKFFGLMYSVTVTEDDKITIHFDGPSSILQNGRSYSLEIAQFFPAILLLKNEWTLEATLKISNRPRDFLLEITNKNPYCTYYPEKGRWSHEKIEGVIDRFNEKYSETLEARGEQTILPLRNNRYLLPDLIIAPKKGRWKKEVMVEWIRYLSPTKIKWLEEVQPELPPNYVFAVKGSRIKLKALLETMDHQILLFSNELTAPALKKKIDELQSIN